MECQKCKSTVDKLYWFDDENGSASKVCLRCLSAHTWDRTVGDEEREGDYFFTIAGQQEAATFLKGLDEIVKIDSNRTLYLQRRSNNRIIVENSSQGELLNCLDITIQIDKV